jgi:hypothetical protein
LQSLIRDVKSLDDLSVPGHSTGVFIGTRGAACPCQRHLDPRVPGLSLEYSHEGRLQTVITIDFITYTALITHIHAGPNSMGRTAHGPLSVEGVGGPVVFSGAFALSRVSEGGRTGLHPVSALVLSDGFCGSNLHHHRARTKSSSEGWHVRLCPNICPPRDQFD